MPIDSSVSLLLSGWFRSRLANSLQAIVVLTTFSIQYKGQGKAEHLYSAFHGIQTTLKRSGMDHTVLPAINTMPALPRKRSPDGTSTD